MTDKRNIVIKVKYPVAGKAAENLEPRMITEWNIKRLLLAAGAVILILMLLFYVVGNDTQETDINNAEAVVSAIEKPATPQVEIKEAEIKSLDISKEANSSVKLKKHLNKKNKQIDDANVKENIKQQTNEKVIKEHGNSKVNHNVARASLTYKINNRESAGEEVRTVSVRHKKPVWVYYLTELKEMNGSKVYHEWLRNGEVVSRQALVISADTWRTSSRKLLSDSEKGNWAVRLVDGRGRLLNEKTFKVE